MRKLAKVISIMLILSMFSTCVYATDGTDIGGQTGTGGSEGTEITNPIDPEDDPEKEEPEESEQLSKPVITSISANRLNVSLRFNAVKGANKYIIAYGTGTFKEVTTKTTTFKVSELKELTKYSFKVRAVYELGAKKITSEWSDIKTVTTGEEAPLKTPTLKLAAYNKGAILSWKKVDRATHYEIWRYYNKKWSKIKTVKATTLKYKNTGLKLNKKYTYKIRAKRVKSNRTMYSSYSAKKTIAAKEYLTGTTIKVGYSAGVLWKNAKKYKKGSNKTTIGSSKVKAGTKITVIERRRVGHNSMIYVKLPNGKKCWIKAFNVNFSAPYTTKDYTTEVKENFVNKKGYKSKTKYLLFICHYTQKVYLFKGSKGKWDLKKTYKCATGKATTRTPLGVYKITRKAKRTPAGSKYVTYFKGMNAFHAQPFGSKTMSKPASNGCIRMYADDAKYIQSKMPKGTTVVSY